MELVERAGLWSRSEPWESVNCSRVFNVQWMYLCPNGLQFFRFWWDAFLQDRWYLTFVCRQLPRDSEYLWQADTGRRILMGMLVSTSVDMLFLRLPIRERWGNIWICYRLKYILHVMFLQRKCAEDGPAGFDWLSCPDGTIGHAWERARADGTDWQEQSWDAARC